MVLVNLFVERCRRSLVFCAVHLLVFYGWGNLFMDGCIMVSRLGPSVVKIRYNRAGSNLRNIHELLHGGLGSIHVCNCFG